MILLSEDGIQSITYDAKHRVDTALAGTVLCLLNYIRILQSHSKEIEAKYKKLLSEQNNLY